MGGVMGNSKPDGWRRRSLKESFPTPELGQSVEVVDGDQIEAARIFRE